MKLIRAAHWIRTVITVLVLLLSGSVYAAVSVIVHPSIEVTNITAAQVANIFLGKTKILPTGELVIPIDLPSNDDSRKEFYRKLVNKSENQLNAYWARQVFTGKGQPPSQIEGCEQIVSLVKGNPGLISYIDSECVDSTVKVILRLR